MVAAIACAEFLGPARLSHFDAAGNPVGKRRTNAVIWLAACSLDGSSHTYQYIRDMLSGPAEQEYQLDIGMTRTLIKGEGHGYLVKQVTASPKSLEGPRPTFVIQEETQNWTPAEQGPELDAVIHRGLGKVDGRRIAVTNAPEPGKGSVAEMTHQYQKQIEDGEAIETGLLFDTFMIHVPNIYDKEQAYPALQEMYKHAYWQNLERIWRDINDPAHSEIDSRRFYFNEMVEPKALWIPEAVWDEAGDYRLHLNKRDKVALGFRVRKYCAAVTATRLKDGATFLLKLWEKPEDSDRTWEVPYAEIDKFVRKTISKTHTVVYVMTSPNGFADGIGRWQAEYEDEVTFEAIWLDRNKVKHADAVDAFDCAVRDRRLKHTGDPDLKRHVMNCFVTEVPQGNLIRMETTHSKRFIVAAEAALLSFQGSIEAIQDGLGDDPPDNYAFSF